MKSEINKFIISYSMLLDFYNDILKLEAETGSLTEGYCIGKIEAFEKILSDLDYLEELESLNE